MASLVFSFRKLKSAIVLYALHTYIKIKTQAVQLMSPQAEEAVALTNLFGTSSHHILNCMHPQHLFSHETPVVSPVLITWGKWLVQ